MAKFAATWSSSATRRQPIAVSGRNGVPTASAAEPRRLVQSFDVEVFDAARVRDAAEEGRPVELRYFGTAHRLLLAPVSIRSPRFRATAGPLGEERTIFPEKVATFGGSVAGDPDSLVRLSVSGVGIRAFIKSSGGWVFIEPLDPSERDELRRGFGARAGG